MPALLHFCHRRLVDLRAWGISHASAERTPQGMNNDTYFVRAGVRGYVLRVYRNTAEPGHVRDEHDLLGALALLELPFAVPIPARTTSGDTLAVLELEDGPRLAALFERIPGAPARMIARDARRAGRAIAQLDLALARVDRPVRAPATIRDVHPLIPEPLDALEDLGAEQRRAARELIARVETEHDALAGSLPRQIVHGDFAYGNVLVDDHAVTGVIDFEFASADVRAADLACALYVTAVRSGEDQRWRLLEALAAGYRRSLALDPVEAAAIPALMRRRNAFGVIHWLGRQRQGIASPDEPLARIARGLMLSAWLDEHAPRVVATVMGAVGGSSPMRRAE